MPGSAPAPGGVMRCTACYPAATTAGAGELAPGMQEGCRARSEVARGSTHSTHRFEGGVVCAVLHHLSTAAAVGTGGQQGQVGRALVEMLLQGAISPQVAGSKDEGHGAVAGLQQKQATTCTGEGGREGARKVSEQPAVLSSSLKVARGGIEAP